MRAGMVYANFYRLGASGMSERMEMINLQTMTGKLFVNGEIIAEYKVETCDKCAKVVQLDKFGYQKSDPVENIIWFCKDCR
jgi:hypothetical protein